MRRVIIKCGRTTLFFSLLFALASLDVLAKKSFSPGSQGSVKPGAAINPRQDVSPDIHAPVNFNHVRDFFQPGWKLCHVVDIEAGSRNTACGLH